MFGPTILARSLSVPKISDEYGNLWQYHSRSDRHSKIACWVILFDLLQHCRLLADHSTRQQVVFGINHEMRDFRMGRKKNLDLVICTPGTTRAARRTRSFRSLVEQYGIVLDDRENSILETLPQMVEGPVGSVHLALEAKACMTAHIKARPRLYDELNSSHLTIHGSSDLAIAAGFVMVNMANTFVSPDRNKHDLHSMPPRVSSHRQVQDTERVIEKIREIPRRAKTGEEGFDALAIAVVDCANDGRKVELVKSAPAPMGDDTLGYDQTVRRIAHLYEARFPRL